jgi:sugar lactone lactonase YvrE
MQARKLMRPVVVPVVASLTLASLTFASLALWPSAAFAANLLWEVKGMQQPESVVQDPATDLLYVSNIAGAVMQKDDNGFIAKLQPDGTVVDRKWVEGLNAPTGLALHDRTLYVADVDELVEINAASGRILKRHEAKGAIFLNDVAVDQDGTVYVSDTPMNAIWRLKDGVFEPWLANDDLNGPNGLIVQDGKLIVASFGKLPPQGEPELGGLFAIDLEDQSISKLGDTLGNLDGLQALKPGTYLVTDWGAGGLYRVAKGKAERLIRLNKGSADFIYFPEQNTVIVPIMLGNTLVSYALD